jgi:hypothetical protein
MNDIALFFKEETSKMKPFFRYPEIKIREQKNGFAIAGHFGPNLSDVLYKVKIVNGKIKVILRKNDIQLGGNYEFENKEEAIKFLNDYFLNLYSDYVPCVIFTI